jgi:AraC-like DNA-binding protein
LLARECGLSAGHFARALPHQWLRRRRVEKAKEEMRGTDASLADIALGCGFANQSQFSGVFGKVTGVSPSAWRRQVRT